MIPMNGRRQILIVGAGAIGGLYAAYLAKLAEVVVLDANHAHVEAIRSRGLTVTGLGDADARTLRPMQFGVARP